MHGNHGPLYTFPNERARLGQRELRPFILPFSSTSPWTLLRAPPLLPSGRLCQFSNALCRLSAVNDGAGERGALQAMESCFGSSLAYS